MRFKNGPRMRRMTLEITTSSGTSYAFHLEVEQSSPQLTRDTVHHRMLQSNWIVDRSDSFDIIIYGVLTKEGKTDPIERAALHYMKDNGVEPATLLKVGDVAVKVVSGDGLPDRNRPLKTGPDLGLEAYVEFDCGPIPDVGEGAFRVRMTILTGDPNVRFDEELGGSRKTARATWCEVIADLLLDAGYKAQVVGNDKIRVYGCVKQGHYYPATEGKVGSPDLPKEELPRVTNPQKKG